MSVTKAADEAPRIAVNIAKRRIAATIAKLPEFVTLKDQIRRPEFTPMDMARDNFASCARHVALTIGTAGNVKSDCYYSWQYFAYRSY